MAYSLQIENFSFGYPGEEGAILDSISFSLGRGECVCITGPTGAGKSTLLLAVQGLLKAGHCSGTIKVNGNAWRKPSGLLFQNIDSQMVCTTVEEEVTFGPDNLGVPAEELERQVKDALETVGLSSYSSRNVERLSAGQKQRVALASILSMSPAVLLLDEPGGQLDEAGKSSLKKIIHRLKAAGHSIVIVEHDLLPFEEVADRFYHLSGGLTEISLESFQKKILALSEDARINQSDAPSHGQPAVEIRGVSWRGVDDVTVLDNINLQIERGELAHLYGLNGAGKSTLLKLIAGMETPYAGAIRTAGVASPRPDLVVGKVALLFQNPRKQFFEDSVHSEVAFVLKMLGYSSEETAQRVEDVLRLCDVGHLAGRSPFSLSFGEQHRVALASVIAPEPEILLLDEPFSGLDYAQRYRLLRIVCELRRRGAAIVLASHGPLPPGEWSERRLVLQDGKIHEG